MPCRYNARRRQFLAMQLDIFEHSRDVMLRNDALQALQQRDAAAARAAATASGGRVSGRHGAGRRWPCWCTALEAPVSPLVHPACRCRPRRCCSLRDQVAPAATRLFGEHRRRRLVRPALAAGWPSARRGWASAPSTRDSHAAALWLQAGDFAAAADAVAAHRIMAAHSRTAGLDVRSTLAARGPGQLAGACWPNSPGWHRCASMHCCSGWPIRCCDACAGSSTPGFEGERRSPATWPGCRPGC